MDLGWGAAIAALVGGAIVPLMTVLSGWREGRSPRVLIRKDIDAWKDLRDTSIEDDALGLIADQIKALRAKDRERRTRRTPVVRWVLEGALSLAVYRSFQPPDMTHVETTPSSVVALAGIAWFASVLVRIAWHFGVKIQKEIEGSK